MSVNSDHGGGARRGAIGLVVVVVAALALGVVGTTLDWWGASPDKPGQVDSSKPADKPG